MVRRKGWMAMVLIMSMLIIMIMIGVRGKGESEEDKHAHHAHHGGEKEEIDGEIVRLQPLERYGASSVAGLASKDKWAIAGTIGNYYELQKVESVSFPVYVNLVFVGFDGDGKNHVKLLDEHFEEWFQHIEHNVLHRVAPIGEEQTTTQRKAGHNRNTQNIAGLKLQYRYALNVVKVSPLVNTIVE